MDTFKNQIDVSEALKEKVKTVSPIDELLSCQRSEQTKSRYLYYVEKFCDHFDLTPQKLLTLDNETIRTLQKNYLVCLNRKKLSRSYIAGIVSGLDKFLIMTEREDAMLTKKMRESLIPASREQKLSGRGAWDEKQIKLMVGSTGNIQTDAILGIFYSTGCRMGAIVENLKGTPRYLRYDDIVDDSNKDKFAGLGLGIENIQFGNCKAIRLYAEDGAEYWSFLTPSVSAILERYLQSRRLNEPGFRENPRGKPLFVVRDKRTKEFKPMTYEDLKHRLAYVIKKIRGTLPEGKKRHEIQLTNGFRHRFVNKAIEGALQPLAISKLMSHSGGVLDILAERGYSVNKVEVKNYASSVEALFNEWKKALPYLEYDATERERLKRIEAEKLLDKKLQAEKDEEKSVANLRKEFEESHAVVVAIARALKAGGINFVKEEGSSFADDSMPAKYEKLFNLKISSSVIKEEEIV